MEESGSGGVQFKVYRRRWAIVVTLMVLNISNAGMCFNLAAVSYNAADYFHVSQQDITWFSQVFLIVPIPLSFVSTFIFNKFDMKAGIHIGSALNLVSAVTRAVATSGVIRDPWNQYVLSLFGQVIGATGQLFITFISTKVAQNWFPDNERMVATALMGFFAPLGISMAEVIAPVVVTRTDQIPDLNYWYGGIGILAEILTLLCITRSKPATPPSRSAEEGSKTKASYPQQLKDTLTSLPFYGLFIMAAVLTGFYLCFSTLSQQMLCSMGYSDLFIGVVVTVFSVAGFIGSIFIAMAANRTKAYTAVLKLSNALGVMFAIILMEIYLLPDQHVLLVLFSFLYGFFGGGVYPITLEIGVEITYPVEETISTTIIYVTGQIMGMTLIFLTSNFSSELPKELENVEVCTDGITSDLQARYYSDSITGIMVFMAVSVIIFITFFKTHYKRREIDDSTTK